MQLSPQEFPQSFLMVNFTPKFQENLHVGSGAPNERGVEKYAISSQ